MRRTAATAWLLVVVGSLAACAPAPAVSTTPTPSVPPASTPSPTPTPTGDEPDFTEPGVAREMVEELLEAAESTTALQVAVTASEVRVAVERDGNAETWAYRDGEIGTVQSDIVYVDQASFRPSDYPLDDVGALFRAARAVSGADEAQELQIVDYSAGIVATTVTTTPESRTVFFTRDGTIVPTLDLTTPSGIEQAYRDAVGARTTATQVVFSSTDGVYLDTPDATAGTITRYQRAPRTPLIVSTRSDATSLEAFDPRTIDPDVIWTVIDEAHAEGGYTFADAWTCTVDSRSDTGEPLLHFQVGADEFVTTLKGTLVQQ